jgi:hypothetical protein
MSPPIGNVHRRAALWATIITLIASVAFYIPLEYARHNNLDFFNMPAGYKLIAYPGGVMLAPGELIFAFAFRIGTWVWTHSFARGSSVIALSFSMWWTLPLTWAFYFVLCSVALRLRTRRGPQIPAPGSS